MKDEFKLPSSSYKELTKIIQAYGSNEKGSGLNELSQVSGIHNTIISANNRFLMSIGLIEGGNKKIPSPTCMALSRAISYNREDEISRLWRSIVSSSDFLTKMLTAIKIRNGMDEQGFANHISYSSGQSNTAYTRAGAGSLVEIFKIAKLIEERDGKLIYTEQGDIELSSVAEIAPEVEGRDTVTPEKLQESKVVFKEVSSGTVNINIQINITATVSELDELSAKLGTVINSIKDGKE